MTKMRLELEIERILGERITKLEERIKKLESKKKTEKKK